MDWATQQGWVTSEEGDAAMQDADQHVTTIDPDTVTLIELGSGWEGATEGFRQVIPRVVTVDVTRCQMGERGKAVPEVRARFERGGERLVRWVAAKAGVSRDGARMVWVSVSCKEGARPNSLGRSRGCGRGGHGGQSAGATWTDEDIDEVVEGITDWERAWPGGVWCLENRREARTSSNLHQTPARNAPAHAI